jgi:16S rRNA processing protein RimM
MSNHKNDSLIAQIGRTVGLWGDLKLYLHTDFPEQFTIGSSLSTTHGELTISHINLARGTVRFVGFEGVDSAKRLTNSKVFSNEEKTRKSCTLKEGEYFWFDMVGCALYEVGELLGEIKEIERMGAVDYLIIETSDALITKGASTRFLLPYLEQFILEVSIEQKRITTQGAKDILEAS